jgi:hypothetical protein
MTAPLPEPCKRWRLKLAATHPDDLDPAERAALEAHLATCPSCAAVYAAYAQMDAAVLRLPGPAPLEALPPKLLALWEAEDQQAASGRVPTRLARRETALRPQHDDTRQAPPFPERPAPRRPSLRVVSGLTALAAVVVIALLTTALLVSRLRTISPNPTPTPGIATATSQPGVTPTVSPTSTPTPAGIAITLYFPMYGSTNQDDMFPVQRVAPSTKDLETYAIQLLIAGPTLEEQNEGYYSELNSLFTGPSSGCAASNPTIGGPDFTLKLNMKGNTPQQGTATLTFCRPISSPGVGADTRVKLEIGRTLAQFGYQSVVILTQDNQCFGDESGANLCLN